MFKKDNKVLYCCHIILFKIHKSRNSRWSGEQDQVWFENMESRKPHMMIDIHFDDEYFKEINYVIDYNIIHNQLN